MNWNKNNNDNNPWGSGGGNNPWGSGGGSSNRNDFEDSLKKQSFCAQRTDAISSTQNVYSDQMNGPRAEQSKIGEISRVGKMTFFI